MNIEQSNFLQNSDTILDILILKNPYVVCIQFGSAMTPGG